MHYDKKVFKKNSFGNVGETRWSFCVKIGTGHPNPRRLIAPAITIIVVEGTPLWVSRRHISHDPSILRFCHAYFSSDSHARRTLGLAL